MNKVSKSWLEFNQKQKQKSCGEGYGRTPVSPHVLLLTMLGMLHSLSWQGP